MAATIKILSTLLFLGLVSQGSAQKCSVSNLSVEQSQTGAQIQGKPEWVVTITNNCGCDQKTVKLNCKGFQTVEQIDPSILSLSGDACLVNNGKSIGSDPITFKYAWDNPFPLNLIYTEITCDNS